MNDWNVILNQAKKLQDANAEWTSLGGRVKYKFVDINEDHIVIDRLNGGEQATLGKKGIANALTRLKNKGRLQRTELISSVVRQTTLIYLHPMVKWDKSKKEVYWDQTDVTNDNIIESIQDANDDELVKMEVFVNERLNQSRFKKNMMRLYKEKCAISNNGVKETLEGAHILSHATSRINSNDNGILLRSDLHKLFDKGLLLINPNTLQVHLHTSLQSSEYWKFAGKQISKRTDGSKINKDFLTKKWKDADWIKDVI